MKKVVSLDNYSCYDEFFNDYKIEVKKHELYYAHLVNDQYCIYDYNTANYIGLYPTDYFGPYELYIAIERNKKIDEILND